MYVKSSCGVASARGDDHAAVDEQFDRFDRGDEQPAGIAPQVDHEALHALAMQLPEGGFEVAAGGLLETGDPQRGDALGGVEHLRLVDAGDLDAPPADRDRPRRLVRRGHGQDDRRALFTLEHVGRLFRGHVFRGDAVDGEDAVAGAEAGLLGGAAADDADDRQFRGVALQLDPQADEVALDLRVDLAELIGREVGRIGIEAVGRAADEFEDRRGGTDFDAALGQGGGRGDRFIRLLPRGDDPAGDRLPQFAAKGVDRRPVLLGDVLLAEGRFSQGDVEVVGAALDQFLPVRRFDVVRLNLHQHAVEEVHRPLRRQLDQRVAEAAVGVTPVEVVMDAGRLDAPLEAVFAGEEPHGVLVIGHGLAPTAIALELPSAPQQIVDLQRAAADGKRGGLLGGEGESRERGEGGKPQSGGVEYPFEAWFHP